MENEISQINNRNMTDTMNKDFELSHIIGLNLKLREPVQTHPLMNEAIIYSVGGTVITEDLSEKNNQVFFRHGSQDIGCFKISNTGRFLAVGFTRGENNFDKKLPVSLIIWDYKNKEILYELTGLYKAIISIGFSNDDKFISALSQENSFYIWEVETGFKCHSRIYEHKIDLIYWTAILSGTNSSGRPEYTITITSSNGIIYLQLFFELKSMQYNTRTSKFTLPSTGLVRYFTCALYDANVNALYLGTSGGEICVFSIDNLIFKLSFNAINNGVTSILLLPAENCLIVGGGDGRIKKIARDGINSHNLRHSIIQEIQLNAKISSLSLASDSKEAVCSLANGYIYRVLTSDLSYSLHSIGHITNINDVCFMNKPGQLLANNESDMARIRGVNSINDKCFTVDDHGSLYLWDLNDFNIKGMLQGDSGAKSLAWGDDDTLYVGYSNGNLKNLMLTPTNPRDNATLLINSNNNYEFNLLWNLPAHKGNVNCIYVNGNYIITGGEDGVVRIWTRKTHELIIQLAAHEKNVYNVFPDLNLSNVIYTCGEDRNLNTFDIKLQKRINNHRIKNGLIRGIAQKFEKENEIISCGSNCNLMVWDFYENESIGEINLNENFHCIKISNNGKYFAMGSEKGEIWIFKLSEFEFLGKSIGHSKQINSLKWSPDDKQIVSVSADSSICIWNFYKIID